jgi:hypothetical protein
MLPHAPLFRPEALRRYAERRTTTILPRTVAPPTFLCCWLLLGLLVVATLLAWQIQVPRSVTALGALLQAPESQRAGYDWEALLFVPASPAPQLHRDAVITVQGILTGETFTGTIVRVATDLITPEEARQRYALTGDLALVIPRPAVVVQVALEPPLPAEALAGSSIRTQVPVGTTSLLGLLPHLFSGLGGG